MTYQNFLLWMHEFLQKKKMNISSAQWSVFYISYASYSFDFLFIIVLVHVNLSSIKKIVV